MLGLDFKGYALYSQMDNQVKIATMDEIFMEINSLLKMIRQENSQALIIPHKIEKGYCFKLSEKYLKTFLGYGLAKDKASVEKVNNIISDLKLRITDKWKRLFEISFITLRLIYSSPFYGDMFQLTSDLQYDIQDNLLLLNLATVNCFLISLY